MTYTSYHLACLGLSVFHTLIQSPSVAYKIFDTICSHTADNGITNTIAVPIFKNPGVPAKLAISVSGLLPNNWFFTCSEN